MKNVCKFFKCRPKFDEGWNGANLKTQFFFSFLTVVVWQLNLSFFPVSTPPTESVKNRMTFKGLKGMILCRVVT